MYNNKKIIRDKTSIHQKMLEKIHLNLSYDGGFTELSMLGGGLKVPPPIFICENHRKSNKIMHCVDKKNIRLAVLKIRPFFT